MIQLPGLIDPHVHMREPGATHKEDWDSGTAAALAGGFTLVLAMPNTAPPVTDVVSLQVALTAARDKAHCDYAQYIGAGEDNAAEAAHLGKYAAGLKMYLDQTYGPLKLEALSAICEHFELFPRNMPIVLHAEGRSLAAALLFAAMQKRSVHVAHVATREDILLVRAAKLSGVKVTCEVTPHHLFLCEDDLPRIGAGRGEVRPRLATKTDQQALWENLDIIDCFASDHAPHNLAEKDGENPPPGFPGLETSLPLLLNAVAEERLSLTDLVLRCHTNPQRIFHLPHQPETWVEVDEDAKWEISASELHTRCGWTPFEGMPVRGRVVRTMLRGKVAYADGKTLAQPGYGLNVRPELE